MAGLAILAAIVLAATVLAVTFKVWALLAVCAIFWLAILTAFSEERSK